MCNNSNKLVDNSKSKSELSHLHKLLFGSLGIFASFLWHGALQEDVFSNGFHETWFLQTVEAATNVLVGTIGLCILGKRDIVSHKMFAISGASQVCSKAMTSLALTYGVSFPVMTLAKSAKMLPVMLGSILIGKSKFSFQQYVAVFAIIIGTFIVSMDKKKSSSRSSSGIAFGYFFIIFSLVCDGVTGGIQSLISGSSTKVSKSDPGPFDMMVWTNFYMALTSLVIALTLNEFRTAYACCLQNPEILCKIFKFSALSAIGQCFIFYTLFNFDAFTCSTITTTRKVFSVPLSIFLYGHIVSMKGWFGICLASTGIVLELFNKCKTDSNKQNEQKKNE